MKINKKNSKPWNNSQGCVRNSVMDHPITVKRVCKAKKVEIYPMNGVQKIHNKSRDTTPKNSNICNISLPKIFIRVKI